ncbi:hypothetical protein [Acinetobacter sp. ANC 3791]|uniref:hypothetical protein n=1 Tax=Acinetobacter sp. ANC 3791 TaxID=2529836 RepID=UPI00103D1598|nr:hypothetical protein [Acinetobacter sp. ANC 3791]TCB86465.1 hypothetical protein E0H90_01185 [Acinetobacter sp. ANC 3791]
MADNMLFRAYIHWVNIIMNEDNLEEIAKSESIDEDLEETTYTLTENSIEKLSDEIIENLLNNEKFKKLFISRDMEDRKKTIDQVANSNRSREEKSKYVYLKEIIPKDNLPLKSSLKRLKSAQQYLHIVEILYRELQVDYVDFPIRPACRGEVDLLGFDLLMRVETFMLSLALQPIPAFIKSASQEEFTQQENTTQLLKRVTRLGKEFLFLWENKERIKKFSGSYFTINVQILAEFFIEKDKFTRGLESKLDLRLDVTSDSLSQINEYLISLRKFIETGEYKIRLNRQYVREGDPEPITKIVKPTRIQMDGKWKKRSERFESAIEYFQEYKKIDIVLYRFEIKIQVSDKRVTAKQFQEFFTVLNKKAMRPEGLVGYLGFLYFWKEDFRTKDLIQDIIIIMDSRKLITSPETGNSEMLKLRDIPNEFSLYVKNVLEHQTEIFEGKFANLDLTSVPVLKSKFWNIPAEFPIELGNRKNWNFFETHILPYFVFMEMFDVDYTDDIQLRFSRARSYPKELK